jgi:hypothetical protein
MISKEGPLPGVRHASTVFNLSQIPPLSNREERYNPPLC